MAWDWLLLEPECTRCGICADVCPHDAVRMTREMTAPEPATARCVGCQLCVHECPFDAVEVKKVESGDEGTPPEP